ncbi:MAG: MBL fold metallo-hydrolase [Thermoproteota archaeon]
MRDECKVLQERGIDLLWFDSMGAKSSSIIVGTVLVDPGAAAMQPSYPLPDTAKRALRRRAATRITEALGRAGAVVITHYHYDHHFRLHDPDWTGAAQAILETELIVAKNPNLFINESQWKRARQFIADLLGLVGMELDSVLEEPKSLQLANPDEGLSEALSKGFGDYTKRRLELLDRGRRWFEKLAKELWLQRPWVKEVVKVGKTTLTFRDYGEFSKGGVRVRLLGPHFHGVEYDRTGWVVPLLIETRGIRLLYTSDLMGPIIEDYALEILREKPHVLVCDGPPTYLYPYMLNRINLQRAIENLTYVLENAESLQLVVYDHHLLRDRQWRKRVSPVFDAARRVGVPLLTASECLGMEPLIDKVSQ